MVLPGALEGSAATSQGLEGKGGHRLSRLGSVRGERSDGHTPPFLSTLSSAEMLPWNSLGPFPASGTAGFLASSGQL